MRLMGFELKKLYLRLPVIIALAVFTVLDIVKIYATVEDVSYLREDSVWERVYWEQYENFSGEITAEKIERLLDMYKPLEAAVNDLTATTRNDVEGTLTGNVYSDKNLLERFFVDPMERFYTYSGDAARVVSAAEENVRLYERLGNTYEARKNAAIARLYSGRRVTRFYYTEGYRLYLNYDFSTVLILLLVLYPLSQSLTRDSECSMTELMLTSQRGGAASSFAKALAATAYILTLSLWFSAVDFGAFAVFSNITDAGRLPLYAAETFREASVGVTLYTYCAMSALGRALGFWALGMVFFALGRLGRRALTPFAAGAGVFVLLTLAGVRWGHSSNALLKAVNPYCTLVNRLLFARTEFVNILGFPVPAWKAGFAFTSALGASAGALGVYLGGGRTGGRGRRYGAI